MSDTYQITPGPNDPPPVTDLLQRRASALAFTSMDEDPEKAARAQELSEATGIPPAVVHQNLENVESQHRAALTSQLLAQNSYLQDYVNSHPLAAKVSNDDWGALDAASQAINHFTDSLYKPNARFEDGRIPEGSELVTTPEGRSNLARAIGKFPIELVKGITDTIQKAMSPDASEEDQIAFGAQVAMMLEGAKLPMPWTKPRIGAPADIVFGGMKSSPEEISEFLRQARTNKDAEDIAAATRVGQKLIPYLSSDKEPPVGLDAEIDKVKADDARLDAKNFAEMTKASDATNTLERSPAMYKKFLEQHDLDNIAISSDAIRQVYGDKVPAPDDNILGSIPNLAERLASAEGAGSYISVPAIDYLSKVDSKVRSQLKDFIQYRPDGISLDEAKNLKPPIEVMPSGDQAIDSVRQAAGLEPVVKAPSLTLQKLAEAPSAVEPGTGNFKYQITGADGQPVGEIYISEMHEGAQIEISNIGITGTTTPSALRALVPQLAAEFPSAVRLTGDMVSGARLPAEKALRVSIDLTKYRDKPERRVVVDKPTTAAKQPKLPQAGTTRMEERPVAQPAAFGMSKARFDKYMKLIEKRQQEDKAHVEGKAAAEIRKRSTKEWKEDAAALRPEIGEAVKSRREIAADIGLRGKLKFAEGSLTRVQKSLIPKEYISEQGFIPDVLATHFGYQSGDSLIAGLHTLDAARQGAGMKPDAYIERMIDAELDRQMEARRADLEKNIIDETKDYVFSATQESLLHEETLALAEEAGLQYTIPTSALRAAAQRDVGKIPWGELSSDSFLKDAGKATRELEEAFLSGNAAEAFRQVQRRELAFQRGREAAKYEKDGKAFEKLAKKYSKAVVPGISPEYVNYIHDLLLRVGRQLKISYGDVQQDIIKTGYKSFESFVDAKEAALYEMHVPDWLKDQNFKKPLDELTTAEFGEFVDALKAMDHNGRAELKIETAGGKADLDEVINEMVEKIKSLGPPKDYRGDLEIKKGISRDTLKSYWWSMINLESMFKRLDRDNPKGVFTQYLVRTYSAASDAKAATLKEFQKKLSEIGDIPDMDKLVDNDLWFHPVTKQPLVLRKRNVLGMLAYAGNKSSLAKLAGGYGLKSEQVMNFLRMNIEREDIVRMEKIGAMFDDLFDRADTMSRSISGVGLRKLPLEPVDFGNLGVSKGWYNPIKYDPLIPGSSKKLLGPNAVEQEGYYRATTPQGYTKERTGYIAAVELNLDIIPVRMRQMIHDIEMRPAVMQLAKVFYNEKFQNAMIHYFGKHQAAAMIPFLMDMANSSNFRSMATYYGDAAVEIIRQNTISTLIGMNPSTVMKHGPTAAFNSLSIVGPLNFLREFGTLFGADEVTGETNWRMALDKSQGLQRRLTRNFSELIKNKEQELAFHKISLRDFMVLAGSYPVALSDFASAVPTWLAKYKQQRAAGEDEGESIFQAEYAVRQAHGSSVSTHKPEIMRTNALGATFSSLYGFFSQYQQRIYELAWKSRDFYKDTLGSGSGDEESAMRHLPSMAWLMASIVWSAAVEEIVTPYTNAQHESWAKKAAIFLGELTSPGMVGVRDFIRALINFREPQLGLIGTSIKTGTDIAHDLSKGSLVANKQNASQFIKHAFALGGVLTALTNAQEGRTTEFWYRYWQGMEKPEGPWGFLVGSRYGTIGQHPKTFDEYLRSYTK